MWETAPHAGFWAEMEVNGFGVVNILRNEFKDVESGVMTFNAHANAGSWQLTLAQNTFTNVALPLALFDKAGKSLIGVDNAISKPMFRDDETKEQGGMSNCGDEFGVVVSSYFSSEDIFDFVFKGDYGLPDKAKFKILELELES